MSIIFCFKLTSLKRQSFLLIEHFEILTLTYNNDFYLIKINMILIILILRSSSDILEQKENVWGLPLNLKNA
jgi:hypothetical protein